MNSDIEQTSPTPAPAPAVDGWGTSKGDDERVHEDSYISAVEGARSQIGPVRPDDDEPEDQWHWDKLTSLMKMLAETAPAPAVGDAKAAARWKLIAPHLQVGWDQDDHLKTWTWVEIKEGYIDVPRSTQYSTAAEAIDAAIAARSKGDPA